MAKTTDPDIQDILTELDQASTDEKVDIVIDFFDRMARTILDEDDEKAMDAIGAVVGWSPDKGPSTDPRQLMIYRVLDKVVDAHWDAIARQAGEFGELLSMVSRMDKQMHALEDLVGRYAVGKVKPTMDEAGEAVVESGHLRDDLIDLMGRLAPDEEEG
jgi:hypothetical protein